MTRPARPSSFNCAKRCSMRLMGRFPASRILPRLRGRWRAQRAGGGNGRAMLHAPSTMRRMVPLPRFAGEEQHVLRRPSQLDAEMVGDGKDILIAAAAHVHDEEMIARQVGRDFCNES